MLLLRSVSYTPVRRIWCMSSKTQRPGGLWPGSVWHVHNSMTRELHCCLYIVVKCRLLVHQFPVHFASLLRNSHFQPRPFKFLISELRNWASKTPWRSSFLFLIFFWRVHFASFLNNLCSPCRRRMSGRPFKFLKKNLRNWASKAHGFLTKSFLTKLRTVL